MDLLLQRKPSTDGWTMGTLSVDGIPQCFTLEPATPMPAGRYPVTITRSTRFSAMASAKAGHPVDVLLPLISDVPGHTGIRIHQGNDAKDTEDCVLVGQSLVRDGFIGQSIAALTALQGLIASALKAGEEVWITIDFEQAVQRA